MSDFFFFYHITESSELNRKIRVRNILSWPYYGFFFFLRKMTSWCKRMYSAIYDVMRSYLTRVRDKKIRNGHITLETRVVM